MAASWYYVDTNGQQVGPVGAEEVRSAVRGGAATTASLAWRDGLPGWQAISTLLAELGMTEASAPVVESFPPPPAVVPPAESNPYRAPEAESGEGYFEGGTDVVYAGFWKRWAALFLDQIIIGLPLGIVYTILAVAMGIATTGDASSAAAITLQLGFYAVWLAVAVVYFAGLESSEAQATFGKRALGIKVTDLAGQRISFKHAVGRWVAAAVSYMSLYIGFAMAGFTQRKQALHDFMAGTLVVDRWAYTRFPERQQRNLGGCAIVFIVIIAGSLILIPIFIAIGVAAYQEQMRRAGGSAYVEPRSTPAYQTESQGNTARVAPASPVWLA